MASVFSVSEERQHFWRLREAEAGRKFEERFKRSAELFIKIERIREKTEGPFMGDWPNIVHLCNGILCSQEKG